MLPKFSAEASSPQCSLAVNLGSFSMNRGIDLSTTDRSMPPGEAAEIHGERALRARGLGAEFRQHAILRARRGPGGGRLRHAAGMAGVMVLSVRALGRLIISANSPFETTRMSCMAMLSVHWFVALLK